jgi:hypothetical protein
MCINTKRDKINKEEDPVCIPHNMIKILLRAGFLE